MKTYPASMPYDDIKIYDLSTYGEADLVNKKYTPQGLTVFQPIVSEKGVGYDNELVFITEQTQLDNYGKPNINKYGISHYLADNALKAGANVLTCRLVADDARPASLLVYASCKKGDPIKMCAAKYNNWDELRKSFIKHLDANSEFVNGKKYYMNKYKIAVINNDTTLEQAVEQYGAVYTKDGNIYKIVTKNNDSSKYVYDQNLDYYIRESTSYTSMKFDDNKSYYMKSELSVDSPTTGDKIYVYKLIDKIVESFDDDTLDISSNSGESNIKFNDGVCEIELSGTNNLKYIINDDGVMSIEYSDNSAYYKKIDDEYDEISLTKDLFDSDEFKPILSYVIENVDISDSIISMMNTDSTYLETIIADLNNEIYELSSDINAKQDSILTTSKDYKNLSINKDSTLDTYIIPLFAVRSKAKGSFANNYNITITNDPYMDNYALSKENDTRFYSIELYDGKNKIQNSVTFTFDDFIYNSEPLDYESINLKYDYIEIEKYFTFDKFRTYLKLFNDYACLFNEYNEAVADHTKYIEKYPRYTENSIDIIFGTKYDSTLYSNESPISKLFTNNDDVVIDYGSKSFTHSFNITDDEEPSTDATEFLNKFYLGNGSNGEFDNIKYTKNEKNLYGVFEEKVYSNCKYDYNNGKEDPFAKYFVRAYSGDDTYIEDGDLIFDEVRMPFRMIFSPSLNSDVNLAIHELINERYSTVAFYGFPTDLEYYSDAREYKMENYAKYNSYKEYFISEHAVTRDSHTHKRLTFPAVYYNAYYVPKHFKSSKGKQFAGADFEWTDFIPSSIQPHSVNVEEYISNHNSGLNTMIENGKGVANPYEQITAQTPFTNSMLTELSYSICLCEMCYIALDHAREYKWQFIDSETISMFKEQLLNKYKETLSSWYKDCEVEIVQASDTGAGQNRLLCKIYVTFKNIVKGVTHEFYIL